MIPVAELLPDADALAEAHREQLAERAADRLRQNPELRRACVMEPDGRDYLVGIAVPIPSGLATAVLRCPRADPFELIEAFDAICERDSSTAAQSADSRAAPASAQGAPHDPRCIRQSGAG